MSPESQLQVSNELTLTLKVPGEHEGEPSK